MKDPRDVILAPVVSEKSYTALDSGVYTFVIHPDASKTEVKDAVQKIFGVRVVRVNTMWRKGKSKRTGYCSPSSLVNTVIPARYTPLGRVPGVALTTMRPGLSRVVRPRSGVLVTQVPPIGWLRNSTAAVCGVATCTRRVGGA